jgi:hypothetical protein
MDTESTDTAKRADIASHADITEEQNVAAHADHLREIMSPVALYGSMGGSHGNNLSPDAYTQYLHDVVEDCGSPRDPIERMIVEQLVLAHANIGRLYMKSGIAGQAEETVAYAAAAGRLTGEFRRLSLALTEYRSRAVDQIKVADNREDVRPRTKTA